MVNSLFFYIYIVSFLLNCSLFLSCNIFIFNVQVIQNHYMVKLAFCNFSLVVFFFYEQSRQNKLPSTWSSSITYSLFSLLPQHSTYKHYQLLLHFLFFLFFWIFICLFYYLFFSPLYSHIALITGQCDYLLCSYFNIYSLSFSSFIVGSIISYIDHFPCFLKLLQYSFSLPTFIISNRFYSISW